MSLSRLWSRAKRGAERRQYFDENLEQELWDLLEASALLDVKEFVVFELAYKDWFGHAPAPHVIEAQFANYMFNQAVPVWVRRYTRKVVELERQGRLDPRQLGVYKRLPSRRLQYIGKTYVAFLLATLLVLTFMAYRHSPLVQSLLTRVEDTTNTVGPSDGSPYRQHNAMP